ncbi:hypothetical protein FOYG_17332 [Fusarium oxysporum NRRL 32931]|uniref:BTB domain-containing protein n=1 Tax=Fusarium oxysporum NRRL 32931 TaxID=660029 RepID=W9HH74_FUSOX|nr:hypothetical protein FOYG_17332 [Fusarium oxysporum NRRL 32931]
MSFSFGSVSGQTGTNAAKLGTWDKSVPTVPFRDHINNELCDFQTFTSHPDYRDSSLEEHRLEDYKNSKGRNAVQIANPNDESSYAPNSELLAKKTLADRNKMELLQGSGVEIQVGTKTTPPSRNGTKSFETWFLPMNLVSHYSPYAKESCSSSSERSCKQLMLQDHQPGIFGLFVEWLYYGCYQGFSAVSGPNIDAQCWVLGNKLLCVEFQNYAMRRLYDLYTRPMFGRPMTCDDVRYVWGNTSPDSKLRKFHMNFVVDHFGSSVKLFGSSTDWDAILQNQSEIRISLLDKFRQCTFSPSYVESIDKYLESNNISSGLSPQRKGQPIPLVGGANTEKAPIFSFDEKQNEKKDIPQKGEPFQLANRTKNYETVVPNFGDNVS